jgi:single-strand DNA-binding protein
MAYPSSINAATLIGRLTRDPELRTASTSAGERSVLSLGLAVRKPVRPGNDDSSTADFFDVTVWGELAETCSRHLYKGRLVVISARLQPTAWEEKDGSKRRGLELVANTVNFLDSPRNTDSSEQQPEDLPAAA